MLCHYVGIVKCHAQGRQLMQAYPAVNKKMRAYADYTKVELYRLFRYTIQEPTQKCPCPELMFAGEVN